MKYKVGDKVRVKSLEWYNENKTEYGNINCNNKVYFQEYMSKFCGSILTINGVDIDLNAYMVEENICYWTDNMLEECVAETSLKGEFGLWENKINGILFSNENYADKVELCLGDDYEIVVECGRTFVQKKKPKYPTTYDECCELLGKTKAYQSVSGYKTELLEDLQKLLICRDAYWKVADFKYDVNITENYFYIVNKRGSVIKGCYMCFNHILAFPTKEMRDAFYENFKDLIENCKELL